MVADGSILVALLELVDRLPEPPAGGRGRGRPVVYPDRLFLKAVVVMVVRHLATVDGLLAVVSQPTAEMARVRSLLTEQGRFPSRRTWQRRLAQAPARLPAQIARLGRSLLTLLAPWQDLGRAAAVDSTVFAARGGVWHKKHREAGVVPHSSIDTEAGWTKSGWHGWVYGWKLHVVTTVAAVWLPLAAELTPANVADNAVAADRAPQLPGELRLLLGDTAYQDAALRDRCAACDIDLVASRRGAYPHRDGGVEVRRLFHHLRSHAIENFNEQFKAIFDGHGQVPTRGLMRTSRLLLGAVLVYQLTLWLRFERGDDLRVGLKAFLKAA